MGRYIVRRIGWCVVVMVLISILAFLVYYVLPPVSPAVLFAGKEATPAQIAEAQRSLGLNHPVWIQFLLLIKHLVLGDKYGWPGLGFSFVSRESVLSLLGPRIVITLTLGAGALVVWLTLGITIGIVSAVKRGTIWDRLSLGTALFFLSAPVFWLGLMLLWILWFKLGIAAGTGYYSPTQYGLLTWFSHMILPWVVLALLYAAWYARMTRGSVLEVLHRDYVTTARGKGLSETRVLVRHVLRAALTPMLTMVGMDLAGLVSGTVVVEVVFNLQGLGQFAINSVNADDIPSVLAVTVLGAFAVVIGNFIVDILYMYVDPRIRYG
ncbi:MAG: ABC transporter permease [Candidatus Dormibacteria bacterium]